MSDDPLQTVSPDQVPVISAIPADAFVFVQAAGGPLQRIPHNSLLAKLISAELVKVDVAQLQADVAHDENIVALVENDPTALNNGWWRKVGASGTGNWVQFEQTAKAVRDSIIGSAGDASKAVKQALGFGLLSDLASYANQLATNDQTIVRESDTGKHAAVAGEVRLDGTAATVGELIDNEGGYTKQASGAVWRTFSTGRQQAAVQVGLAASAVTDLTVDQSARITQAFSRIGYILLSTGALQNDAVWRTTPLYEIAYLDIARIKLYGATTVASIAFYDASGVFISGVAAASSGAYVSAYPAPPANAVYVCFTMRVSDLANQRFTPVVKFGNLLPSTLDDQSAKITKLFTASGYIRSGTSGTAGTLATDANWVATPLIEVAYVDVTRLRLYGDPAVASVAFYDASGAYISGSAAGSAGTYVAAYPAVPSTAAYVRFSARLSVLSSQKLDLITKHASLPPSNGNVRIDLMAKATIVGYYDASGVFKSDVNWRTTGLIDFPAGGVLNVSTFGHTAVSAFVFYDATGTMLARDGSATNNTVYSGVVTAPANTVKVALSTSVTTVGGYPAGFVATAYYTYPLAAYLAGQMGGASSGVFSIPVFKRRRAMKMSAAKIIRTVGDSRLSTDYAFVTSVLQDITGATVHAGGASGRNVAYIADDARMQLIFNDSPDALIFLPGGNDLGVAGTVGTFSGAIPGEPTVTPTNIANNFPTSGMLFIQAVDHVVRKILAYYYDIRARANLTGSETEAEKNAKIRAVKLPQLVVCTDLPQQRGDATQPASLSANWERKRQAIIEVCARNKVHCVDTMAVMGWDMTKEPFYVSPTTQVNNGIRYMDGVHQNEFGYREFMEVVVADAGWEIAL